MLGITLLIVITGINMRQLPPSSQLPVFMDGIFQKRAVSKELKHTI